MPKRRAFNRSGQLQDEEQMAETEQEALEEILAQLRAFEAQAQSGDTPPTFTQPLQNGGPMPALTDEIKEFIVKGLACYDTPTFVAEAVKVNFGIEISRQQVHVYDPDSSQPPAQRWCDLHAATRAAFLRDAAEIGIANRIVRLRRLDRLASRCEKNSVALALICLQQAAKECGGLYENRRRVDVQVSVPQQPEVLSPAQPSLSANGPQAVVTSIRFPQLPNLSGSIDTQPLNANRQ
jgi:hypothetical protein